MVMEDKKQTEEGMVDFSSWKVLALSPISKSCWSINLGASYLAGYFMCLLSCAELLINHINSKYPGECDFKQIS